MPLTVVNGYEGAFGLHLDRVEAFAVDAADGALRDEGLAVDHLNEAEDVCPLAVAGHEHDHLDRLV